MWAQRSASSRYAVDQSTVTPETTSSFTMRHSSRRDSGSTPTPGSSSRSSRGRPSSAHASPSFCFMPPEAAGEPLGEWSEIGEAQELREAPLTRRLVESAEVRVETQVVEHREILV